MVLDTSAIFAFLARELDADLFENALNQADPCLISAFTVYESRLVLWKRFGLAYIGRFDDMLLDLDAEVRAFDNDQATLAFAAYRRFGKGSGHPAQLNLGDCAAYALATSMDLPLLFKGNDFARTDVRPALA